MKVWATSSLGKKKKTDKANYVFLGSKCADSFRQKSPITSTSLQRKQVKGVGGDHSGGKQGEKEQGGREDA